MTTMTTMKPMRWEDFLRKIDPINDTTLRWPDILRITGLKKSQVKTKIDSKQFPPPFLISDSGRALGFHASEIAAWCASRDAQRAAMLERGEPRGIPFPKKKQPPKKVVRR